MIADPATARAIVTSCRSSPGSWVGLVRSFPLSPAPLQRLGYGLPPVGQVYSGIQRHSGGSTLTTGS